MRPIVLATDGSPTATAATEQAIELAAGSGAPLVIVTVWNIPYTGIGYAPVPLVVDVDASFRDRAPQIVAEVAARARAAGVVAKTVVRRGFPVDEICRVAEERDARLIVIGSHGWGPVRRTLFGSVSRGVLQSAHRPVLVVPAALAAKRSHRAQAGV